MNNYLEVSDDNYHLSRSGSTTGMVYRNMGRLVKFLASLSPGEELQHPNCGVIEWLTAQNKDPDLVARVVRETHPHLNRVIYEGHGGNLYSRELGDKEHIEVMMINGSNHLLTIEYFRKNFEIKVESD